MSYSRCVDIWIRVVRYGFTILLEALNRVCCDADEWKRGVCWLFPPDSFRSFLSCFLNINRTLYLACFIPPVLWTNRKGLNSWLMYKGVMGGMEGGCVPFLFTYRCWQCLNDLLDSSARLTFRHSFMKKQTLRRSHRSLTSHLVNLMKCAAGYPGVSPYFHQPFSPLFNCIFHQSQGIPGMAEADDGDDELNHDLLPAVTPT